MLLDSTTKENQLGTLTSVPTLYLKSLLDRICSWIPRDCFANIYQF